MTLKEKRVREEKPVKVVVVGVLPPKLIPALSLDSRSVYWLMNALVMSKSKTNIIWIDMEMTGLNPDEDRILEVACVITDQNLETISDDFNLVINQPKSILDNMKPWCIEQHSKSGLINESLKSTINILEAEEKLLKFLQNKSPQGECPLAGNSVYMDKLFLLKHMNRVANHLHYRIIDVSSLFELVRRWYPRLKLFKKNCVHRALPDIKESILQLKYYREKVLKPVDEVRNTK